MHSKVSTKGWVVIPAALRKRYRLKPGTVVGFREEGEKILIVPRGSDPVEGLFGKQEAGSLSSVLRPQSSALSPQPSVLSPRACRRVSAASAYHKSTFV
jgi:AbrB family looped-hinge helix DNA binding protein